MKTRLFMIAVGSLLAVSACKRREVVKIDGSSTVYPISEEMTGQFRKKQKDVHFTVGFSGTGGGFKKFCRGDIDITGASRPIKPSEVKMCSEGSIEYIELPVAYDGLAVIVHPNNKFATQMTVEELRKLWAPESEGKITKWSQIRAGWPEQPIKLYGPGPDSGTFDYFTKAIVGKEHSSRGDYSASENDQDIVLGVSGNEYALGYFGYAYYKHNKDKLALVSVDDGNPANGAGPILPSPQSVADGTYQPLSRPIFIYVAKKAAKKSAVKRFVEFYIARGKEPNSLVAKTGYIPFPASEYDLVAQRFASQTTGSLFEGKGSKVGATISDLLKTGKASNPEPEIKVAKPTN